MVPEGQAVAYFVLSTAALLAFVFGAAAVAKIGRRRFREFTASTGLFESLPVHVRRPAVRGVVIAEVVLSCELTAIVVSSAVGAPTDLAIAGFAGAAVLPAETVGRERAVAVVQGEEPALTQLVAKLAPPGHR